MKRLPELYKNTNISLSNNKKYCYVEEQNNIQNIEEIENKIKSIIHETNNNNQVIIKTKDKEYKTIIVAKVNNNIITLNNDKIPIKDIISINSI
jgi:hypothetical protein